MNVQIARVRFMTVFLRASVGQAMTFARLSLAQSDAVRIGSLADPGVVERGAAAVARGAGAGLLRALNRTAVAVRVVDLVARFAAPPVPEPPGAGLTTIANLLLLGLLADVGVGAVGGGEI